jgi:hypothetical protein
MILIPYQIAPSLIPGAGQGVFLKEPVKSGQIIIAPDAIPRTWSWNEIQKHADRDTLMSSSVRWFEEHYTVTPEWPDECYVNHSFDPTGIWHLGFVFARTNLKANTEITVDYRHLLREGQEEVFRDTATGKPIIGLPWAESLRLTTEQVQTALMP